MSHKCLAYLTVTSNRPYLIRAMHEWITDNGEVPYVIVDVKHKTTIVPQNHIDDEQIILNLSVDATHNLVLGNDLIYFSARFNGVSEEISFAPEAILGIFDRDTGKGMMFEPSKVGQKPQKLSKNSDNKSGLRLVKNTDKKS